MCSNCEASVVVIGSRESRRAQLDQLHWRLGCGVGAGVIADADENGYCCPRCSNETADVRAKRLANDVVRGLSIAAPFSADCNNRGKFLHLRVEPEPLTIPFDLGMRDADVRESIKSALVSMLARTDPVKTPPLAE